MSDTPERTPEEQEANALKLRAEARLAEAEAAEAEAKARVAEIAQTVAEEKEAARLLDDDHQYVYRFLGQVDSTSVKKAVSTLVGWHRRDPSAPITFLIDSPGGSIIDGFHLFDTLLWLRRKGHHVTTVALGMAASMAGVLLQAGDVRIMAPQSALLIHEASFGAIGSMGKIEDQVEFVRKLQDRILDIFAERASLGRTAIKNRWKRKDWWMMADEALKHGFVDSVE